MGELVHGRGAPRFDKVRAAAIALDIWGGYRHAGAPGSTPD